MRQHNKLFFAFLLCLVAIPTPPAAAQTVWQSASPNNTSGPALSHILNSDGSIDYRATGSFDTRGYKLEFGRNGEPIFKQEDPAPKEASQLSVSGTWDPTFGPNSVSGASVHAMVSDSNRLFIGGDFTYFNGTKCNYIIQYDKTTRTWTPLANGLGSAVFALAIHNGELYVGGTFIHAGSTVVNNIAKWNGTKWTGLGGGFDNSVDAIAFVGDTLYAGGVFSMADPNNAKIPVNGLAKWDGTSWSDVGGGVNGNIYSMLADGDSLYVGGSFSKAGNVTAHYLALWTGGYWQQLGGSVGSTVNAIAKHGTDLWVGGAFYATYDNTTVLNGLGKWDGSNWSGVGSGDNIGTNDIVDDIIFVGDTMYISGGFSRIQDVQGYNVAKYVNGVWTPVGDGTYGPGFSIASFEGTLYLGGRFTRAGTTAAKHIAKYSNGTWSAIGNGAEIGENQVSVTSIAITDTFVYVGGFFSQVGSQGLIVNNIAAWNKYTKTWQALGSGPDEVVYAMAARGHKLYVGGALHRAGGAAAQHIAMWDADSKTWSAMGAGSVREVHAIAVNQDGVYASVFYPQEDGVYNGYIGKWDGSNWQKIDGAIRGFVECLAVDDSALYVGGSLNTIDGNPVNGIAKHDPTGWYTLGNGVNSTVAAIQIVGSGQLYACGYFSQAGGIDVYGVAYWDENSGWSDLAGGLNNIARSLAWDGKNLYVGGAFTAAGFTNSVALIQWDGSAWNAVEGGMDNEVLTVALDSNNLYAGGFFSTAGTVNAHRFAELHLTPAAVKSVTGPASMVIENYPNPFSASTTLSFNLDRPSHVTLEVFDWAGRRVATVANGMMSAGPQTVQLQAPNLASGVYTCRLMVSDRSYTHAMLLTK